MLIETVLRKKIEPIVWQIAGSTQVNAVWISEGSFQNMLQNKQKPPRRHTLGKGPGDWESEDLPSTSCQVITSECHGLKRGEFP